MLEARLQNIELFFSEIHETLCDYKIINIGELIKKLPDGLNTKAKVNYLKTFGENINKKQYINFLKKMTHGGDYISFDYLIKHYKLKINSDTDMINFSNQMRYKDICQEALYMWWVFRILKNDPFIGQYFNQDKLYIIRQQKIETDILPTNSNFRFDFGFKNLNILFEVNEYAHEADDKIITDKIKNDLVVLCGFRCITIKVKDVFNMCETEYDKLSDEEIHNKLANSQHLKIFAKDIKYKVKSALMQYDEVRNEYIIVLFKQILHDRMHTIIKRINININTFNLLEKVCETKQHTNDDIVSYIYYNSRITSDKKSLESTNSIITSLNDSEDFISLFNIKQRCLGSTTCNIITFTEIIKLLKIKTDEIKIFRIFIIDKIFRCVDSQIEDICINWEELSEIILNYDTSSSLSIMLQIYYIEVGRSYEIIISMLKSHTDSLHTNKDILTNYVNHTNKKTQSIIETLQETNIMHINEKNKEKVYTNSIITKLEDKIYNIAKYRTMSDNTTIENMDIIDDLNDTIIAHSGISNYMRGIIKDLGDNLHLENYVSIKKSLPDSELK